MVYGIPIGGCLSLIREIFTRPLTQTCLIWWYSPWSWWTTPCPSWRCPPQNLRGWKIFLTPEKWEPDVWYFEQPAQIIPLSAASSYSSTTNIDLLSARMGVIASIDLIPNPMCVAHCALWAHHCTMGDAHWGLNHIYKMRHYNKYSFTKSCPRH